MIKRKKKKKADREEGQPMFLGLSARCFRGAWEAETEMAEM